MSISISISISLYTYSHQILFYLSFQCFIGDIATQCTFEFSTEKFLGVQVAKRREYLFNYMLFLRITPTLPNTFINVCSPIVDIPFRTFLPATVIGVIPATFITVRVSHLYPLWCPFYPILFRSLTGDFVKSFCSLKPNVRFVSLVRFKTICWREPLWK